VDTREGFARHREWERELAAARLSVVSWPPGYGGRGRVRHRLRSDPALANAGHNLPYIRTDAGVIELRATGMPLPEKGAADRPPHTPFMEADGSLVPKLTVQAQWAADAGMALFVVPGTVFTTDSIALASGCRDCDSIALAISSGVPIRCSG
jgi:hypothetical protein